MNFVLIADALLKQEPFGGGELNNDELCKILRSQGHTVIEINSGFVTLEFIEKHIPDHKFIIGNFLALRPEVLDGIGRAAKYVIYEHDHKYLRNRNPAMFKDFVAPAEEKIFQNFYKAAQAVLCQSQLHKYIVEKNLGLNNIHSLSGNLWTEETLNYIEDLSHNEKSDSYSIMESLILHKNTGGAVQFCRLKKYPYEVIPPCEYGEFLTKLSKNKALVFFPQTPETLSRIAVEARMLGCQVITNNLIGAASEQWFKLGGKDLIDMMRSKRKEIPETILKIFSNEDNLNSS